MPESRPTELIFEVDNKILNWIDEGCKIAKEMSDVSEIESLDFNVFGKSKLKKLGKVFTSF